MDCGSSTDLDTSARLCRTRRREPNRGLAGLLHALLHLRELRAKATLAALQLRSKSAAAEDVFDFVEEAFVFGGDVGVVAEGGG